MTKKYALELVSHYATEAFETLGNKEQKELGKALALCDKMAESIKE